MKIEFTAILKDMYNGKPTCVIIDGIDFVPKTYKKVNIKKLIKPPKNPEEVYFDTKYHIHIMKDDIKKVKQAICHVENNWISDFKHIQKFTKIKTQKLQRILVYLRQQGIVKMIGKQTDEDIGMGIFSGKKKWNKVYEICDKENES